MKRILLIFASIVMTLTILGTATITFPILAQLNESQKTQKKQLEEEIQQEQFYHAVEQICLEYVSGENEVLVERFNAFLEENSISQERVLDYTKRLKTYNKIKYEEYVEAEKELETIFNDKEISKETFEKEKKFLLKEYENSRNSIEDYLNSKQKEAFENSKEAIEELFQLI